MKTKQMRLQELETEANNTAPEILVWYSDEEKPPEVDPETGRRRILVEYDPIFRGL